MGAEGGKQGQWKGCGKPDMGSSPAGRDERQIFSSRPVRHLECSLAAVPEMGFCCMGACPSRQQKAMILECSSCARTSNESNSVRRFGAREPLPSLQKGSLGRTLLLALFSGTKPPIFEIRACCVCAKHGYSSAACWRCLPRDRSWSTKFNEERCR